VTTAGGRSARPLWQMRNFGIFWAAHPVLRSLTAVAAGGHRAVHADPPGRAGADVNCRLTRPGHEEGQRG
jgi:hypothetical protein